MWYNPWHEESKADAMQTCRLDRGFFLKIARGEVLLPKGSTALVTGMGGTTSEYHAGDYELKGCGRQL